MEKKYSIVIHPSQAVIDLIKEMKEFLALKVGWFNSKNSVAHITICEFKIEESQIDKFKQKIIKICDTFTPFPVHLDHYDSYDNGAFFISPNEDSKMNLKPIMKKTQDALQLPNLIKSNDPHISIGRKLTPESLKIASHMFTTIDMDFLCDNIVLREFDPIKKQFFVIDTFPFGSNPQPELVQGSLF
ncbi:2'-5' RNA ligase family protein [Flavobacterium pectinovorum]|uniref:2'-5' RNA ligase family protein n=1 Tax=Flavobacterium pectinovorum TaxID=29533 RepID=A0A502EN78_9FLAO|nr:2'-5' RNA ligase family protein [Flavobacterium pectinovorum]TPG38489.1 2'-5' RNA ligase family protein [Flavobacterium pectinovorum]